MIYRLGYQATLPLMQRLQDLLGDGEIWEHREADPEKRSGLSLYFTSAKPCTGNDAPVFKSSSSSLQMENPTFVILSSTTLPFTHQWSVHVETVIQDTATEIRNTIQVVYG
jgi:hypothetical protein